MFDLKLFFRLGQVSVYKRLQGKSKQIEPKHLEWSLIIFTCNLYNFIYINWKEKQQCQIFCQQNCMAG